MRVYGYNNCPFQACFKALYQFMCYLYQHPLVYIISPKIKINKETSLRPHSDKEEAEITNYDYTNHTGLKAWSDSEFVRDAQDVLPSVQNIHATQFLLHGHIPSSLHQEAVPMKQKSDHYPKQPKK